MARVLAFAAMGVCVFFAAAFLLVPMISHDVSVSGEVLRRGLRLSLYSVLLAIGFAFVGERL